MFLQRSFMSCSSWIVLIYVFAEIAETTSNSTNPPHRAKRSAPGSRLTYEERVDFLKAHNNFRRNVSPTASDMEFMVSMILSHGVLLRIA